MLPKLAQETIVEQSCDGIANTVHALRGVSSLIGARVLFRLSDQIEKAARAGQRNVVAEHLEHLLNELRLCLNFIPQARSV